MLRRAAALTLLAVLPLLAACSSDATTATSSGSPSATDSAPTTAAPTTAPPALEPQPDPAAAAAALIDAWRAGDAAGAAAVATPAAVQALFGTGTPQSVEARGCSDAKYDPAQCVYRTDLGEVQIRTTMQGDGWVVDQARVTAA